MSLRALLSGDLDFHGEDGAYASHNWHAFPAKFPPQLPHKFIVGLTQPGDLVVDPMVGSGTTVVEAMLAGRRGIGYDIDPLALRLCKAKTAPPSLAEASEAGYEVLDRAQTSLDSEGAVLSDDLARRFEPAEREFVDYWFAPHTQLELVALIREIERFSPPATRVFLEVLFSSVIITKSGGVSLARDLAHTRPHRADKSPRSALDEFRKRLARDLRSLVSVPGGESPVAICEGNAQALPLPDDAVDLIVTSPPYAANAIDYMRAHKFSLIWFGHPLKALSELRQGYIGHDAVSSVALVELPVVAARVLAGLAKLDVKKARALHRYYSEMTRSLCEMARVLKPGKAAVVVVGVSTMRGIDTRTAICLAEIGKQVGLHPVDIAVRRLDRDKRMMPARKNAEGVTSPIEERMHEEYVIGFVKPSIRLA